MSAKQLAASMSLSSSMTSLNADAVPRCSTHRKRLKFFCVKHELLLCSVCAVKKHRSCEEILTIAEASEEKKTEGLRLLDAHAQRIALIENAVVERKAAKKLLDTNVQEILNEIHQVTEKVMDLVKHEERVLVESVQAMQSREAETLDDDISGLETTVERVRKVHDTLSQGLKQSEIDLIYSVLKEKQQNNEGANLENIVKKRFREVDFKFMVSPHVTSFLRHFKSLGQVMLSDETGNSRVPRSGMSTPVSEISGFSTPVPSRTSDEYTDHSPPNGTDDGHLTAREKWQRDRQRQMQSQIRDHVQNDNVFRFDQPNQGAPSRDRRNLPMRALPRPETPEVYSRPRIQATRQDFVPRPTSTPPTEVNSFSPSPKSRDVDRFNTIAPYRAMRKDFNPTPDRRSPVPIKSPPASANGRVDHAQQGENVFSYNQGSGKPNNHSPSGENVFPYNQGSGKPNNISPPGNPHSRWGPSSSPAVLFTPSSALRTPTQTSVAPSPPSKSTRFKSRPEVSRVVSKSEHLLFRAIRTIAAAVIRRENIEKG